MKEKEWLESKIFEYNKNPKELLLDMLYKTLDVMEQYHDNPKSAASKSLFNDCMKYNKIFLKELNKNYSSVKNGLNEEESKVRDYLVDVAKKNQKEDLKENVLFWNGVINELNSCDNEQSLEEIKQEYFAFDSDEDSNDRFFNWFMNILNKPQRDKIRESYRLNDPTLKITNDILRDVFKREMEKPKRSRLLEDRAYKISIHSFP